MIPKISRTMKTTKHPCSQHPYLLEGLRKRPCRQKILAETPCSTQKRKGQRRLGGVRTLQMRTMAYLWSRGDHGVFGGRENYRTIETKYRESLS
mmetsp:Transcript_6049/g.37488  ORF Transcript_6049/g.37488 Transcript_6049/m.37488 type:complete len:94 (+) Transcript_6049:311-592(+)